LIPLDQFNQYLLPIFSFDDASEKKNCVCLGLGDICDLRYIKSKEMNLIINTSVNNTKKKTVKKKQQKPMLENYFWPPAPGADVKNTRVFLRRRAQTHSHRVTHTLH
jgi:hypothetical protein